MTTAIRLSMLRNKVKGRATNSPSPRNGNRPGEFSILPWIMLFIFLCMLTDEDDQSQTLWWLHSGKVGDNWRCEVAHYNEEGNSSAHQESDHADLHTQLPRWTKGLEGWGIWARVKFFTFYSMQSQSLQSLSGNGCHYRCFSHSPLGLLHKTLGTLNA